MDRFRQRIQTLLQEVFNTAVDSDWEVTEQYALGKVWESTFKVKGVQYDVSINLREVEEDKTFANISFMSTQETSTPWGTDRWSSWDVTNTGNAFEVFSKVIHLLVQWLSFNKAPDYISFEAKEPSRVKLYRRMIPLIRKIGYEFIREVNGVFTFQHI